MTNDIKETAKSRKLRERAEADYSLLQSLGLNTSDTFYPPGTEIAYKSAIARERKEFEECDLASDGLEALANAVHAENRLDTPCLVGGEDSQLGPAMFGGWSVGADTLYPTERATIQLGTRKPYGHPAANADMGSWIRDVEPKPAVLRTRSLPPDRIKLADRQDGRECYALVSEDYKPYDLDAVANDLMPICPAGSRSRIRYDGARARIDILLQNPYRLDGEDAGAVGETNRVILRIKTADDGTGGYNLALLAERVRCINLTKLHASKTVFRGTHRNANLRDMAQAALEQVGPLMAAFQAQWSLGWLEAYADKYSQNVLAGGEALRRIVMSDMYRIPGLNAEETLKACLAALTEEPGDTRNHVHNALTRAAHMAPIGYGSRWADDEAEETASELYYQHVSWLPEVEAD